jgi:hypothetical protein
MCRRRVLQPPVQVWHGAGNRASFVCQLNSRNLGQVLYIRCKDWDLVGPNGIIAYRLMGVCPLQEVIEEPEVLCCVYW